MIQNKKTAIVAFTKTTISILMILIFAISSSNAQEKEKTKKVKSTENKPVSNTFFSGIFLENQTYIMNDAKAIELVINHVNILRTSTNRLPLIELHSSIIIRLTVYFSRFIYSANRL